MIALALKGRPTSVQPAKPDENRFTPVVLVPGGELDEPMAFEVVPDGRVYIIERKGGLKVYDPQTKRVKLIATLPVNTKYTNAAGVAREAEEGLLGLTLDPNFAQTRWVYMLYAHPSALKHVLARWVLRDDDTLVEDSEVAVLEYATQRETCCHTGGGMAWDAQGNLYLAVGNNTGNVMQYAQTDERPGRANWDDQRTSANTNDLRGKILRIRPQSDGTYTIPPGNLFPPGTPGTRPEIYAMGLRNPWRVSIDSKTGWLYWGDVGPDASQDSANGPRGYDEHNQARGPGFFGWPYFVGENLAYPYYDFVKDQPLGKKDPNKPINASVNNTGLRELPSAQPAFISYPYGAAEKFPLVGTGARSAVGGPIFHRADFRSATRLFPDYYEGKWLTADLSRGWIMSIAMDERGDYRGMERFLPGYKPIEPIDLKFGPDGDLYVLEYGSRWFQKSDDAKLVRIEYNAGNRTPKAQASSNRTGGPVPFRATLSTAGTKDFDGDALTYVWSIEPESGGAPRVFRRPEVTVPFDRAGVYFATLTVTDTHGAEDSTLLTIVAGNDVPAAQVKIGGNETFFFPDQPLEYAVDITDREDGSLAAGQIPVAQVAIAIDYVREGFDVAALRQGDEKVDAATRHAVPRAIMAMSDCKTCHNLDTKSNGPSYLQMAEKYQGDAGAVDRLATKIREGGSGVWGEATMPAHPGLTMHEARSIMQYLLAINDKTISVHPVRGSVPTKTPDGDNGRGAFVVRTVYTDKGARNLPPHTVEALAVRRSAQMSATRADLMSGATTRFEANGAVETVVGVPNSYIAFTKLDLTGIRSIALAALAPAREGFLGGTIEVRLGSPTGAIAGEANVKSVQLQEGSAEAQLAAVGRGRPAAPIVVPIPPTTGFRDVYLVFKNDSAKTGQPLVSLSTVTFSKEPR
ncbi:MAG TPA: PQQ-dependent sugar dehydrogenase [Vicinamibacterales bacterium]|nr:PQQ-dependent sugar dehydrogenase [Vicinamibacterales bacterium]